MAFDSPLNTELRQRWRNLEEVVQEKLRMHKQRLLEEKSNKKKQWQALGAVQCLECFRSIEEEKMVLSFGERRDGRHHCQRRYC